jgi:hypothetical protein
MGQESGDRGQETEDRKSRSEVGEKRKAGVFHGMENFFEVFPRYGKLFDDFSTVWKTFLKFFHAMENLVEEAMHRGFPRTG